jgi:hypothetical protein
VASFLLTAFVFQFADAFPNPLFPNVAQDGGGPLKEAQKQTT